jgi:hypothetical protein
MVRSVAAAKVRTDLYVREGVLFKIEEALDFVLANKGRNIRDWQGNNIMVDRLVDDFAGHGLYVFGEQGRDTLSKWHFPLRLLD